MPRLDPEVFALVRRHLEEGTVKPREIRAKILVDTGLAVPAASIYYAKEVWHDKRQRELLNVRLRQLASEDTVAGRVLADVIALRGILARLGKDALLLALEGVL